MTKVLQLSKPTVFGLDPRKVGGGGGRTVHHLLVDGIRLQCKERGGGHLMQVLKGDQVTDALLRCHQTLLRATWGSLSKER